jgi:hypothetical protein
VISFVQYLIRQTAKNTRDLALILGIGPRMNEDNRRVLEQTIFPRILADPSYQRILFVGCHWYTWHYKKIFATSEFWTLEIDPARARYGSSRHITDSVENVKRHFDDSTFDVVMILGVIGWGLNDPQAIENSLGAMRSLLRKDGLLIVGIDEVPEHTPVDLSRSLTLNQMHAYRFPGLDTARYRCEGELKHTFTFYRR